MRLLLALALFAAVGVAAPVPNDTYDLRGPDPKKGQTVTSQSTLKIKNADLELSVQGQKLKLKQTMTVTNEEEEELLEVKGREIMKSKVKIIKEVVKTSLDGGDPEEKPGDLEGETILSTREKDGKWVHKLEDGKPNEDQEKELKKRSGPENEDELYPAEKVAVGHAWTVDAAKMKNLTGNSFTDVKGKMQQKFLRVEKVDGEELAAVIETKGTITGKLKDDDGTPDIEMKIAATGWRSLKSGLEVKGEFKGTIKIEGKTKINDEEVEMKMEGPIEAKSTAKLK